MNQLKRQYSKSEKSLILRALSHDSDRVRKRDWVYNVLGVRGLHEQLDAGFVARLATLPIEALRDYKAHYQDYKIDKNGNGFRWVWREEAEPVSYPVKIPSGNSWVHETRHFHRKYKEYSEVHDYWNTFEQTYGLKGIKPCYVESELAFRERANLFANPTPFLPALACRIEQQFSQNDSILNNLNPPKSLPEFWKRLKARYHLAVDYIPGCVSNLWETWTNKNTTVDSTADSGKPVAVGLNGEVLNLYEDDGSVGFYNVIIANSANVYNHDGYKKQKARFDNIRQSSDDLASRLEAVGVKAYIDGSDRFTKIGLLSGISQACPQAFRHILLLPSITEQDRKQLINQLSYWADNDFRKKAENLRYFVVTCENVPFFGNLRKTHTKWMRRISSTFSELSDQYGINLQLRMTDISINETEKTVNLHANVLFHASQKISNEQGGWRAVLSDARQLLQCRIHDAGKVQDSTDFRKIAGYMCKAFDLRAVENDSLKWLADELIGLRIVQRYNNFKGFSKRLRDDRLRVINHHKRGLVLMKKRRVDDSELFEAGTEDYATTEQALEAGVNGLEIINPAEPKEYDDAAERPEEENKFLGIMLPHCAFLNVSEPVLIVRNYTKTPATVIGKDAFNLIETLQSRLRSMLADKLCHLSIPALRDGNHEQVAELINSGGSDINALQVFENMGNYKLDISTTSQITPSPPLPVGVSKGGCQPPLVVQSTPPPRLRWPYHRIKSTFKPVSQLTPQTAVETCAKSRVERPERRYPAPRIQRDPVASEQAPASLWHRVELPADGSCPF